MKTLENPDKLILKLCLHICFITIIDSKLQAVAKYANQKNKNNFENR